MTPAPESSQRVTAAKPVRVQAATVRVRQTYVAEKLGDEAAARYRAACSPALQQMLDAPDPRGGWVPFELFVEANVVLDRLFGRGDLQLAWEAGRFAASHNLGVWKNLAMRRLPPSMLMSLSAGLWSHHYDGGRLSTRAHGNHGLIVGIQSFPTPHRAHCQSVGGWMVGSLEIGPHRNIQVVELSCRIHGGPSCDFRLTWE